MNLSLAPEQLEMGSSVRNVLSKEFDIADLLDPSRVKTKSASLWKIGADLGWFSMGLSNELGGLGLGLMGQVVLAQELGRALAPGPFLATVVAAQLAAKAGESELAARLGIGWSGAAFLAGDYAVDAEPQALLVELGANGGCLRSIWMLEEI